MDRAGDAWRRLKSSIFLNSNGRYTNLFHARSVLLFYFPGFSSPAHSDSSKSNFHHITDCLVGIKCHMWCHNYIRKTSQDTDHAYLSTSISDLILQSKFISITSRPAALTFPVSDFDQRLVSIRPPCRVDQKVFICAIAFFSSIIRKLDQIMAYAVIRSHFYNFKRRFP